MPPWPPPSLPSLPHLQDELIHSIVEVILGRPEEPNKASLISLDSQIRRERRQKCHLWQHPQGSLAPVCTWSPTYFPPLWLRPPVACSSGCGSRLLIPAANPSPWLLTHAADSPTWRLPQIPPGIMKAAASSGQKGKVRAWHMWRGGRRLG